MKRFLTLGLAVIMLCGMILPICAAGNGATPYFNNAATVSANFVIQDSGEATVRLGYVGYEDYTTGATITSKLQKKVLWWWSDVNGASWTDEAVGDYYNVEHSYQLTSRGTYRVVYEFEIRGTAGAADVISDTIEDKY